MYINETDLVKLQSTHICLNADSPRWMVSKRFYFKDNVVVKVRLLLNQGVASLRYSCPRQSFEVLFLLESFRTGTPLCLHP